MDARNVSRQATGGSTCGSAWSAGTWGVVTRPRTSTRPSIFIRPGTRSSGRSSRARTGAGVTWTRSRSDWQLAKPRIVAILHRNRCSDPAPLHTLLRGAVTVKHLCGGDRGVRSAIAPEIVFPREYHIVESGIPLPVSAAYCLETGQMGTAQILLKGMPESHTDVRDRRGAGPVITVGQINRFSFRRST